MRIVLANPRGFCAGVHMAIQVVEQLVELVDGPVYVYHDIVHNTHVVRRFQDEGVIFVEDIQEVPEEAYVVFSAHGIPPQVRAAAAERNLKAIDATCPLVTKVHMEAIRYAKRGYQILLVGHADHQEIIGTSGEAPEQTQVVETPDDIPNLQIDDPTKLVYLTQTTLSTDDADIIINALKRAFPGIQAPPTDDICYATTNRQHAVRELAPSCDLTVVVGSTTSSNSKRLTEISQNVGTPGVLIDDVTQLDRSLLVGVDRVLVTAGASVPEDLVQQLCRVLVREYDAAIEVASLVDESTEFQLPKTLRDEMRQRGIEPEKHRVQIGRWQVTPDLYGTVPVTISAPAATESGSTS
ncbi:MAG: 4-hydroxy-3-methylbut-2-enyl diphosphate reductase [Phycisphaerales bacterium JB050]